MLHGLAGWLEGLGLRTIVGSNELLYRRWQVRELCSGCWQLYVQIIVLWVTISDVLTAVVRHMKDP